TSSYKETGIQNIYAGVNPQKLEEAYEAIINVIADLKKNGFTGTGLAQPKPAISIINAPIGSKCANGFSVSRPAAFAVLSPRQYAT
ncbi:MAG: insulinase family protein, partial [Peptococcaceae bacterium]|nr:insulinase family protein [Peptococcaceae bacterium]